MRTSILILSLFALCFFSCQQADNAAAKAADVAEKTKEAAMDAVSSTEKYKLTPFDSSTEFEGAKITSMTYNGGEFKFKYEGGKYKLGAQTPDAAQKNCANSGKGQHIHLIVDDKPYAAKYVADFEHDVEDGSHYLLAFLSRSYHESIKSPGAAVVKNVSVKNKTIVKETDVSDPMLFYSRPKGTYTGKANTEKVMLDFFLANINLENGTRVKVSINGEDHLLDTWQPYYIEGLPMGENTVELSLLDASGKLMNIPLNPVKRTFTLKADPLEN